MQKMVDYSEINGFYLILLNRKFKYVSNYVLYRNG